MSSLILGSALNQLQEIGSTLEDSPPSPTNSGKDEGLPFTLRDISSDYTPRSTKVTCFV